MSAGAWPSVALGALGAGVSLCVAWALARRRARARGGTGAPETVDAAMRALEARRESEAADRGASLTSLLRDTLDDVTARLQEVQLPLHILLASPFGELNENQEEMLGAAHAAADAADQRVRLLRKLIALASGDSPPRRQAMALRELLRAPLAIAEARAAAAHAVLRVTIAAAPRRVLADPSQTQEALTALLVDAVGHAPPDGEVLVDAADEEGAASRIVIDGGGTRPEDVTARLARRLIERQGGRLLRRDGCVVVTLPAEEPTRLRG